jgi:hypothetical protein
MLQSRDQEERARISAASQSVVVENPSSTTPQDTPAGEMDSRVNSADNPEGSLPFPPQLRKPKQPLRLSDDMELPRIGTEKDWQPEAWIPQSARRSRG